jgi:BirA family transcriptional regulator, biotin operon repressor / biotin---[acetyl-CoA-carboxylase] ligase
VIEGLEARLRLRVVEHGRIESTMVAALEDGGPAPALHLAESQSLGRGRLGRTWTSPPGNLYATIRWPEGESVFPPGILGAIQIEWARAIRAAGGPNTRCKWPNDGWLEGAKWAGTIAVRPAERPGEIHLGLGANLVTPPPGISDAPVTTLERHWSPWPGREEVSELLLAAAVEVMRDGADGVRARLAEWPRYDAIAHGERIDVEAGGRLRSGTYLGIDADGRLRLAEESGEARISSGEVARMRPG